jgi:hypothetical protein
MTEVFIKLPFKITTLWFKSIKVGDRGSLIKFASLLFFEKFNRASRGRGPAYALMSYGSASRDQGRQD